MSTIKGYCKLKSLEDVFIAHDKDLDPEGYAKIEREILDVPIRILDIAVDGNGFLAVAPNGVTGIDVRDMKAVDRWFECEDWGFVLIPPGLDFAKKMLEASKRIGRKGGYNDLIRRMVVMSSLHYGKFNDDFLFQCQ